MGTPTIRGWGGVNILDIGGRAPKPLEKAGQVSLGTEQTETNLKQKKDVLKQEKDILKQKKDVLKQERTL